MLYFNNHYSLRVDIDRYIYKSHVYKFNYFANIKIKIFEIILSGFHGMIHTFKRDFFIYVQHICDYGRNLNN